MRRHWSCVNVENKALQGNPGLQGTKKFIVQYLIGTELFKD